MVKSVQKAMNILKLLSDNAPNSTPLKDIASGTGIEKPTCVHLLATLCRDGYVIRTSHSEGYRLGPATYCLTRYGKYEETLVSLCHPVLRWLSKKTDGISILAVIDNCEKYIIDYIDPENAIFKHTGSIFTDDIYRTATGRIILSHMDREALTTFYEKHKNPDPADWSGIDSFEKLKSELEKIKRLKYVYSSTKRGDGFDIGIGSAIFKGNKCVGAIGIAHNSVRDDREVFGAELPYFEKAVREISRRLNYSD